MGQYFLAANIDTKEFSRGEALKLMETSYVGNDFTYTVEKLLTKGNDWYKTRVIWAGDYFDENYCVDKTTGAIDESYGLEQDRERFMSLYEYAKLEFANTENGSWHELDILPENTEDIIHGAYTDEQKIDFHQQIIKYGYLAETSRSIKLKERYLLNFTKKEFVDLTKLPVNKGGYIVHPMPILLAGGNGQGGGDYDPVNDHDSKYVGSWVGSVIGYVLSKDEIPNDFMEIEPGFKEKW